jgi:hypothetical protein
MYTRADWEVVNSIKGSYTAAVHPNPTLYCVTLLYVDVRGGMIITSIGAFTVHPLVEVRCWFFIHCCREAST